MMTACHALRALAVSGRRSYEAYVLAQEEASTCAEPDVRKISKYLKVIDRREKSPTLITETTFVPIAQHVDPNAERRDQVEAASEQSISSSSEDSAAHERGRATPPRAASEKSVAERFAEAQTVARRRGLDASLQWKYDEHDELAGATCGGASFSREELVQLSACWAGGR